MNLFTKDLDGHGLSRDPSFATSRQPSACNGSSAPDADYWRERISNLEAEPPTPFMLVDLEGIRDRCTRFRRALPGVTLLYAMKALPATDVLIALKGNVDGFDAASLAEIDALLDIGVDPNTIHFNNPVKAPKQIAGAFAKGVTQFACQSSAEVRKIARNAPTGKVSIRVQVDDADSLVPLSPKFGCSHDDFPAILTEIERSNLLVSGASFHVGSQATDPELWCKAIRACAKLLETAQVDSRLTINIGGGFPARYTTETPDFGSIASEVLGCILNYPEFNFVAEPGRFLVAEPAAIVSTIVAIEERQGVPWIYLDVGQYQAFVGASRHNAFPHLPHVLDPPTGSLTSSIRNFTLTGPSCDSFDVIHSSAPLPAEVGVEERLIFPAAGAYTTAYGSDFNGFAVPTILCIDHNNGQPDTVSSRLVGE